MSKARDDYYEFKKEADLHHEGLCDRSYEYIKELESKNELNLARIETLSDDLKLFQKENIENRMKARKLRAEKAELIEALREANIIYENQSEYEQFKIWIKTWVKPLINKLKESERDECIML